MTDIATGFRDVDRQPEPQHYKNYLDDVGKRVAIQKRQSMDLLRAFPGARLLDVGCGLGQDVLHMSELVGTSGAAIGIDLSSTLIEDARRLRPPRQNITFMVGDAHALPFPDDWFDGARTDRTLQHTEDPHSVLKEMTRVVKPGGRIVATEPDWGSLLVDAADAMAEDQMMTRARDTGTRNGRIGRQLLGHFTLLGMTDVDARPVTLVIRELSTAAAVLRLADLVSTDTWAELTRRDDQGRFFAAVTGFTVSGLVP